MKADSPAPVLDYAPPRRFRFRWRWRYISLISAAFVLGIFWFLLPGLNKTGGAMAEIDLLVGDAATGAPITNATVSHPDPTMAMQLWAQPVATDASGKAVTQRFVGRGEYDRLLYAKGGYGSSQATLMVSAPGYQPARVAPGHRDYMEVLGFRRKFWLSVEVRLTPIEP